jgi:cation transport regulator ChaB
MLIFLDTEFTSLEEPYLVSAGLVAGERELYFEIAGVSPMICSPFVQATVLPLLAGPVLQPIEIAAQLIHFLHVCGPEVTFFCDAPRYDISLLMPFLPSALQWKYTVPSFLNDASEKAFNIAYEDAFASGLRRHHALDDAKALAAAWSAVSYDL